MKRVNIAFLITFIIPLFFACVDNPTTHDKNFDYSLQYQVNIPDMNLDSIHIKLEINNWERGDSINLLAPPVYADNPPLVQTGINFCNVSITDTSNVAIVYRSDSIRVGAHNSFSLHFDASECPVIIEYDVKFLYVADSAHSYMPVPHINEHSGYLQGNYLFVIPYNVNNTVNIWRDNFDLQVTYNLGSEVCLYGDPTPTVNFKTPYQLMFSKSALLFSSVVSSQILFEGETCGQAFRCINISLDSTYSSTLMNDTKNDFTTILQDISPLFGIIKETPFTIILGINRKIGLEGMYAFCLRDPWEEDSKGVVAMTMAHEFIHSWIGIRVGDYEDPWWKEGTTNYLGLLIAKKNNLCTQSLIEETFLDSMDDLSCVDEYRLSDEEIRSNLYLDGGIGRMVYRKGAQVNMLLDRYIRDNTQSEIALIDILSEFIKEFDGKSFYRGEYILFINEYSNGNVQDIFDKYVDNTGAIPISVLKENFNALGMTGAFGDFTL